MKGTLFLNNNNMYVFKNEDTGEINTLGKYNVKWIHYLESLGWSYQWTHADGHTHYFQSDNNQ